MDLDRAKSVELEKRDHIHSSQTILKTPEKPPSPIYNYRQNHVTTVLLAGVPIVCLFIDGKERLCLAQISNTLLKTFSYNEIHNRRVALGITCVQCTPVQLEILRRAGAMPISSRRCGMITKREAERLVKSFLEDNSPPKLPDNFYFEVEHNCGWGCRGRFEPSRYNSSRAKCIKCTLCSLFFSPNKFIFHFHRTPESKYNHPDAANFNSWRRHLGLVPGTDTEDIMHAWEDVKAMFNGGSRKRILSSSGSGFTSTSSSNSEPKKPKLHLDDAGISKPSFQGQYPNYPMFSVPGKSYPFAPLAAHNQLGITFPFGKESSHHEVAKQCHSFNHTPWRSSSNFIFPSYDLLWANHFNMGNVNSPVTNFRPNMYQSHNVKDLSLFSVDRHSPSDSANSTEDDDSQMSPIGTNTNSNFSQSIQRLSAFKPVHKIDNTRSDRQSLNLEQTDENEEKSEPVENSDIDIEGEIGDVKDKSKPVHLINKNTIDKECELKVADSVQHIEGPKVDTIQHIDDQSSDIRSNADLDKQQGSKEEQTKDIPEKTCYMQKYDNNNEVTKNKNGEVNETCQNLEIQTSSLQDTTTESDAGKTDGDTREQVEQTINRIQGSLQEQPAMEKCEKDEIAQQLQILKDALCSELEQERQIRYSMQQKLKEAHDALHNFSCKILSSRQCTDCTFKDTASTIPR